MNHMDSAPINRIIEVFGGAEWDIALPDAPTWHRAKFYRAHDSHHWQIVDDRGEPLEAYIDRPQGWREVVVQDA